MVNAIKNAIPKSFQVEVIATASLWSETSARDPREQNYIYCPLTIQLPYWLDFPGRSVFATCRDIEERRAWVANSLHYKTCSGESSFGDLWLPILLCGRSRPPRRSLPCGERNPICTLSIGNVYTIDTR